MGKDTQQSSARTHWGVTAWGESQRLQPAQVFRSLKEKSKCISMWCRHSWLISMLHHKTGSDLWEHSGVLHRVEKQCFQRFFGCRSSYLVHRSYLRSTWRCWLLLHTASLKISQVLSLADGTLTRLVPWWSSSPPASFQPIGRWQGQSSNWLQPPHHQPY